MRQLFRMAVGLGALVVGLLVFSGVAAAGQQGSPPKGYQPPPKGSPPNGHQPPPSWGKPPPNHCGCKPPPYPPPPINTSSSYVREVYVGSSTTVGTNRSSSQGFDHRRSRSTALPTARLPRPRQGPSWRPSRRSYPHDISLNGGPAVPTSFGKNNTFVASGTNPTGGTNTVTTCVVVEAQQGSPAAPLSPSPPFRREAKAKHHKHK